MHSRFKVALVRTRDRSPVLMGINYMLGQLLYRAGLRRHYSGGTLAGMSIDECVNYAIAVFRDYCSYGGFQPSDLTGRRVLEIGPGDNLGVALLFAGAGANVTCIEKFQSPDTPSNRNFNRALAHAASGAGVDGIRALLTPEGDVRSGIELLSGLGVDEARSRLSPASFDLVLSRAVLEHVADLPATWQAMDDLLTPGGISLHKVDFRNHGFFASVHPLHFLTVPDRLWAWMSSPDPTLNRARISSYEHLSDRYGYDSRLWWTHLSSRSSEELPHRDTWRLGVDFTTADVQTSTEFRRRRCRRLKTIDDRDLLINGIFIRCRKPQ